MNHQQSDRDQLTKSLPKMLAEARRQNPKAAIYTRWEDGAWYIEVNRNPWLAITWN